MHWLSLLCWLLAGRVNPVPFELKEDHMGLGRWTMEASDWCGVWSICEGVCHVLAGTCTRCY